MRLVYSKSETVIQILLVCNIEGDAIKFPFGEIFPRNDKNKAINSGAVTGGSVTARIWAKYMTAYHKRNSKPQIAFKNPKHPLDDKLPFYITMKMSMEETIDDFSASLKEASNSISKGKSLIKNVTQTLKKIF